MNAHQRVDAPDRPGMAWGPRFADCSITPTAKFLSYHLTEPYDLVVGQAMGGPLGLRMLEFLQHKPRRLVLVDPPIDVGPIAQHRLDALARTSENPPDEAELMRLNPEWTREEGLIKRFNGMRSDVDGMYSFLSVSGAVPYSMMEHQCLNYMLETDTRIRSHLLTTPGYPRRRHLA